MSNIFRTISSKFYQNRHGFVNDVTKTFGVFGFAVPTAVHLQNMNAKFHKVVSRHYSDQLENM